jgi:hypothetical protein
LGWLDPGCPHRSRSESRLPPPTATRQRSLPPLRPPPNLCGATRHGRQPLLLLAVHHRVRHRFLYHPLSGGHLPNLRLRPLRLLQTVHRPPIEVPQPSQRKQRTSGTTTTVITKIKDLSVVITKIERLECSDYQDQKT